MSKKLEDNGLRESNRMILPVHNKNIIRQGCESDKKHQPILDEQRINELVRTISVSLFTEKPVRVQIFGEIEDRELTGKIDKIATDTRHIKIDFENSFEWIKLEDVLEMEIVL
jgi:hypothetical protein